MLEAVFLAKNKARKTLVQIRLKRKTKRCNDLDNEHNHMCYELISAWCQSSSLTQSTLSDHQVSQ